MTTSAKAASNGSTATTATKAASKNERLSGMARIREGEIYHTASVMHDAIYEADRLCAEIYRVITDAYFKRNQDQDGADPRTITEIAESGPVQKQIDEALSCLGSAQIFLERLISEPPF